LLCKGEVGGTGPIMFSDRPGKTVLRMKARSIVWASAWRTRRSLNGALRMLI